MKIAVVGVGPRGLSICERLLANHVAGDRLDIYLFDPEPPGGRVWSKGSDPGFLMNVICQQVTLFTDKEDVLAGPIQPGPSLLEWCQQEAGAYLEEKSAPRAFIEEAASMAANQYSSRGLFGYYQQWFFAELQKKQNEEVRLNWYDRFVVGYEAPMTLISDGGMQAFDKIVLTTGHFPNLPNETEAQLSDYADEHDLFYQTPEDAAFVETHLIGDRETVLIKGLGLTFFDYIQHFALGRGGSFKETGEELRYLPSGREPRVFAGSGSGFPYYPRGVNQREIGAVGARYLLTEAKLDEYRQKGQATDFFDLLRTEVVLAYYTTMLAPTEKAAFVDIFLREGEGPALAAYPLLETAPWDWAWFSDPGLFAAATKGGYQQFVAQQIAIASAGNQEGPVAAAFETLKDHGGIIQEFLQKGLFDGKQYEQEILGFLGQVYGFVTTGPPVQRSRELLALLKAGVFQLLPPDMKVTCRHGRFVTKSLTGEKVLATALIEGRIPTHHFTGTLNPILQDLRDQGLISRYHFADSDLATEAVNVDLTTYQLIDNKGEVVPAIYCLGIPLEGAEWLTTQIPFKGRHNHFLWQTDRVARHILAQ